MPKTPPAPGSPKPTGGAAPALTLEFAFERETKNTTRYQEVVEGEEPAKVGTLYINKSTGITGPRVRAVISAI